MDITVIGTSDGVPQDTAINVEFIDAYKKEDYFSFTLVPRKIEYEETFRCESPNWPRTHFKALLKDVRLEGGRGCERKFLSDGENIDQEEFLSYLAEHRFSYHILLKNEKEWPYVTYWLRAAVIDNKIVGGTDITVLWDSKNHTWLAESL